MRIAISFVLVLWIFPFVQGQQIDTNWYSEIASNGISIQNSFPKGGPYTGATGEYQNASYLVFFTRVLNESNHPFDLTLRFTGDPIAIPGAPGTFVKLFLPADTMTLDKQSLFSYGVTELASLDQPTRFHQKVAPDGECLFYVVAFFYQTKPGAWNSERGGNRAELVLNGYDLYYRMPPQIDSLHCGHLIFNH